MYFSEYAPRIAKIENRPEDDVQEAILARWNHARRVAKEDGRPDNWDYAVSIFQRYMPRTWHQAMGRTRNPSLPEFESFLLARLSRKEYAPFINELLQKNSTRIHEEVDRLYALILSGRMKSKVRSVTLPKGSILFHGTCENLSGHLRPGGYDQVAWFADTPTIAQLYICGAGDTTVFQLDQLFHSSDHDYTQIRNYLGIKRIPMEQAIYWNVRWDVPEPNGWSEDPMIKITQKDILRHKENTKLLREDMGKKEEGNPLIPHLEKAIQKKLEKIKELKQDIQHYRELDMYRKADLLMEEKGFRRIGKRKDHVPLQSTFEARFDNNQLIPPGEHKMGTLIIAQAKRDMLLWNKAAGEGDLMNVQYHDLKGFRDAEMLGLDGVLIDDFAQSVKYGNIGHLSVGLFDHALLDLRFKKIKAPYREFKQDYKTEDYSGPTNNFRKLK